MTTPLTGAVAARIRDDLTQPCPANPAHRIRPVTVRLYVRDGERRAALLGVCDDCWQATEVTVLDVRVPVTAGQIDGWRRFIKQDDAAALTR